MLDMQNKLQDFGGSGSMRVVIYACLRVFVCAFSKNDTLSVFVVFEVTTLFLFSSSI